MHVFVWSIPVGEDVAAIFASDTIEVAQVVVVGALLVARDAPAVVESCPALFGGGCSAAIGALPCARGRRGSVNDGCEAAIGALLVRAAVEEG